MQTGIKSADRGSPDAVHLYRPVCISIRAKALICFLNLNSFLNQTAFSIQTDFQKFRISFPDFQMIFYCRTIKNASADGDKTGNRCIFNFLFYIVTRRNSSCCLNCYNPIFKSALRKSVLIGDYNDIRMELKNGCRNLRCNRSVERFF